MFVKQWQGFIRNMVINKFLRSTSTYYIPWCKNPGNKQRRSKPIKDDSGSHFVS